MGEVDPQRAAVVGISSTSTTTSPAGRRSAGSRRARSTRSARGRSCRTRDARSSVARCGNSNVAVPPSRQELLHPRDEVVEIRHLREDVVAEHEARPPPSSTSRVRGRGRRTRRVSERHGRQPPRRRSSLDRCRAPGSRAGGSAAAGSRRCEATSTTRSSDASERRADDHLDVPRVLLDPRVGIRGEVRVLREDAVRRDELRDLHQPAVGAYLRVEGVEDLRLAKLRGRSAPSGRAATSRGRRG